MQDHKRSFPRLVSVLILTLTLLCSPASAQSTSLSGSYGFLANAWATDSSPSDVSGFAILGVINFDGAGNVTGTITTESGGMGEAGVGARTLTGNITGTYSVNPDGTGSLTAATGRGGPITFAMVIADGGQGLQLVVTNCSGCAGAGGIALQGTAQSLSGSLPVSLLISGATGNVPLSLPRVSAGGALVYTATGGTGSGTVPCPDGSTGNYTASLSAFTVVFNPSSNPGFGLGDYLLALSVKSCLDINPQLFTLSGPVSLGDGPAGTTNLLLQGAGAVISGIGRPVQGGGSLNGSYGLDVTNSPSQGRQIGVLKFDGAGNVAGAITFVGAPGGSGASNQIPVFTGITFAGTYSVNPDGTGTISFPAGSGKTSTYQFVITDGGSQLLLLQTEGRADTNVSFGTARLQ